MGDELLLQDFEEVENFDDNSLEAKKRNDDFELETKKYTDFVAKQVNINPRHPENLKLYRQKISHLLLPALKAYRRSFKLHADEYVEDNNVCISVFQFDFFDALMCSSIVKVKSLFLSICISGQVHKIDKISCKRFTCTSCF